MNLFNTILEKLGIKKPAPAPQAAAPKPMSQAAPSTSAAAPKPAAGAQGIDMYSVTHPSAPPQTAAAAKPAAPAAMPMVDVVSKLEKLAAESGQKLDWKVSIVDLLKILKMDSSQTARTELATELGCPPELMNESAKMNTWLHKTVLQKIAENGGNVPASLLD